MVTRQVIVRNGIETRPIESKLQSSRCVLHNAHTYMHLAADVSMVQVYINKAYITGIYACKDIYIDCTIDLSLSKYAHMHIYICARIDLNIDLA